MQEKVGTWGGEMIIQRLDEKSLRDAEREFVNAFSRGEHGQFNPDIALADWAQHWGPVFIEFAQVVMEEEKWDSR